MASAQVGSRRQAASPDMWTISARVLTLFALVYAIVRAGAVDSGIQFHVGYVVLAAIVISMLRSDIKQFVRSKIVVSILALWTGWLVLTAVQSIPLPASIVQILSPEAFSIREQFVGSEVTDRWQSISLIPMMTQTAWPIYAIGLAFFLLGVSVWDSRKGRTTMLVCLAIVGGLVAAWGLIQRAKGSSELLPGVTAPSDSLPFSTFIYKNAGASVLLAAIAACIGLTLVVLRPALRSGNGSTKGRDRSKSERSSYRGQTAYWIEPSAIAVYLLLLILALGLLASISKGAWIGAALAVVGTCFVLRSNVNTKVAAITVCLMIAVGATGFFALGLRKSVASRAGQMDLETLSGNDRFRHWSDAAETISQFPILGSGLGTYGYAHLPNQDQDTPRWFQHAHNQPLEWAVECGLVGMLIVLAGVAAVVMLLRDLYRGRKNGTTPMIWFVVGLFAFTSIGVQSLADFSILTPAVMWMCALLLGVCCSAVADGGGKRRRKSSATLATEKDTEAEPSWLEKLLVPASQPMAWSIVAAGCLLLGQSWLKANAVDEAVLRSTKIPSSFIVPTEDQIAEARETLLAQAKKNPHDGRLWQRLAKWDLLQYRLYLMKTAELNHEKPRWEDSKTHRLFQIYQSLDATEQQVAQQIWLLDDLGDAMERSRENFGKAIWHNPLVPQNHLELALMAPFNGEDYRQHAARSRLIAASNGNHQFTVGMLSMYEGDHETMVTQWRRGLRFRPENISAVLTLASKVMTPDQITDQILVDIRPNVWVAMVRNSFKSEQMEPYREAFVRGATRAIQNDTELPEGTRQYQLALMSEFRGDEPSVLFHSEKAVAANPGNADYRYKLAIALMRNGDFVAAREQVSFGSALAPGQPRWRNLIEKIDRRIAESTSETISR